MPNSRKKNGALVETGVCPVCGGKATSPHYITPLSYGGEDTPRNKVLLCKRCHDIFEDLYDETSQAYSPVLARIIQLKYDLTPVEEVDDELRQDQADDEPVVIVKSKSRKCKYPGCQKFFTPKRKDQQYCKEECRVAHYDEIYYHRVNVDKICPNCGTLFPTSKPYIQVFCEPGCREDARNKSVLGTPLEHLDKAIEHMNKLFVELKTPDNTKVQVLAKYYAHYPNYIPAEPLQQTNSSCDLCDKNSQKLVTHNGHSLCSECTTFAEYIDQGMYEKYRELLSK